MELSDIRTAGSVISLAVSFVMGIYLVARRKYDRNGAQLEKAKTELSDMKVQVLNQEIRISTLEESNRTVNHSLSQLLQGMGKIDGQMTGLNNSFRIIEEHLINKKG